MNVGQLRKILDNPEINDSDEVVVSGTDHSYKNVYPECISLLEGKEDGLMFEDYGMTLTPEMGVVRKNGVVFRVI